MLGEKADAVFSPVPHSPWGMDCGPRHGAVPLSAGPRHHTTGTTTTLPHSPMAGEGSQRWEGSAWKGLQSPPTPPWHPQPGADIQGTGSPWWRQCWPGWGRQRGDGPVHRLFSEVFIGVLLAAAGERGTQHGGDTSWGAQDKDKCSCQHSTAGGAEEPQGWLQSCGAAVGADESVAQICVAIGSCVR